MRAELLPPLPPGGASSGASGYFDEPCRLPLRDPRRSVMQVKRLRESADREGQLTAPAAR